MLKTIILREIQEHLKSYKFQIGFLIMIILISISVNINIRDYIQRNQDYIDAKEETKNEIGVPDIYKSPQVLSILVQGKDRKLGNKVSLRTSTIPDRTTGYMGRKSRYQQYMSGFTAVDLAFIVRVVISLIVIFLAFSTISEEKSNKTLSLVLSNSISRDKLLLGKFLGGMIIIIISFLIALILSLLMLIFQQSVVLGKSEFFRILAMTGVSILYISAFYTLGLFVSTLINRPPTALMVLLQVWIFLVILYPALSVIIAENIYQPHLENKNNEYLSAFQPYESEYKRKTEPLSIAAALGERPTSEQILQYNEAAAMKAEVNHRVDLEFKKRLDTQTQLVGYISILSPAVMYDKIMLRFARTDMTDYDYFFESVFRFWKEKVKHEILSNKVQEGSKKSKIPDFSYKSESIGQSFLGSLLPLLVLFMLNVIFFVFSYITLLRKDVR